MVTYGDMMGLLLCFFIMLVAMSEVKAEKFKQALESIQSAFGSVRETEKAGSATPRTKSIQEYLSTMSSWRGSPENMGGAETVNLRGSEYLCRTTSEGLLITFGLDKPFEPGSAVLSEEMKKELGDLAREMKGYTNLIVVRGHCSSDETGAGGQDAWTLGFARAHAAADWLIGQEIAERRVVMVSVGNTQPLVSNLSVHGRAGNRRIEVVVTGQTAAGR